MNDDENNPNYTDNLGGGIGRFIWWGCVAVFVYGFAYGLYTNLV